MTNKRQLFLFCTLASLALASSSALAQISGSASLVSDYLYRGLSLTQGGPALQLTVNYDDDSGFYAGTTGSNIKFKGISSNVELLIYAGYAQRLDNGWNLDGGVLQAYFPTGNVLSYHELFAGASTDLFNAKLYYSPDYYGLHQRSFYSDFNGSYPLSETLSLIGHLGFLHTAAYNNASAPHTRYDLRLGSGWNIQRWNMQLAWVSVGAQSTAAPIPSPHGVVLSTIRTF